MFTLLEDDAHNAVSRFEQIDGTYLGNGELDAEILAEVGDLMNLGATGFVLAWHPHNDSSEEAVSYARIIQIPQPRVLRSIVIEGMDGVPVTVSPNLSENFRYVITGELLLYDLNEYAFMRKEVEAACVKSNEPRAYFNDGGEIISHFTLNYASYGDNDLLFPTVPNVWMVDADGKHICRVFTEHFKPATLDDLDDQETILPS